MARIDVATSGETCSYSAMIYINSAL